METIRFDDIDALNALASEEFGEFGDAVEVTQEMINGFADLTGDHQWIHVDVERCKRESPFGGPIAHGFLTLSLVPRLGGGKGVRITGQTKRSTTAPSRCASSPRCRRGRRCTGAAGSCGPRRSRAGRS